MPRSNPPSLRLALSALALSASLTACAHPTPTAATRAAAPAPVNTACTAFGLIQFSRLHDTAETIVSVKAHNAAWTALCGPPF